MHLNSEQHYKRSIVTAATDLSVNSSEKALSPHLGTPGSHVIIKSRVLQGVARVDAQGAQSFNLQRSRTALCTWIQDLRCGIRWVVDDGGGDNG